MRSVLFAAGLWVVMGCGWAQLPAGAPPSSKSAPAKVDKALRARAEEFLLDQTEGNFRKAFDLVAEDSQDFYLSMSKEQLSSPKISDISYADKFTTAYVTATVVRKANMGAAGVIEIPSTRIDTWKQLHGKWMWYHDPQANCLPSLIGALPCDKRPGADRQSQVSALPKSTSPEAVAAAAKELIVPKAALSRDKIDFVKGQAGVQEISFHNGYPGAIRVLVGFTSNPVGFKLDNYSKLLPTNGDFTVKIEYTPGPQTPDAVTLGFTVEPFGNMYMVPIRAVIEPAKP